MVAVAVSGSDNLVIPGVIITPEGIVGNQRHPTVERKTEWLIMAGLGLVCLLWAFTLYWRLFGDDVAFLAERERYAGVLEWVQHRVATWSSRVAIEAAVFAFPHYPILWRIVTALAFWLIMVLPPWFIAPDFQTRKWLYPISAVLLFSVPTHVLFQVGYVATAANYLWPFAAGLVVAIPAMAILRGQRFLVWVPLAVLATFYAASSEIVAVFLMVLYLGVLVARWRKLRLSSAELSAAEPAMSRGNNPVGRTQLLTLGLFTLGLIAFVAFHLLNPGNALRTTAEIANHFPSFGEISIWRRAEMGYSNTLRVIFLWRYFAPLIYFGVIAWVSARRNKAKWLLPLALVPLVAALLFSEEFLPESYYTRIWNQFGFYGLNILRNPGPNAVIVFLLLTALLIIIVVTTIAALGRQPSTFLVLVILALGFASQTVMGFSPTIWTSGNRTHLYLIMAFNLATMLVISGRNWRDKAGTIQGGICKGANSIEVN